MNEYARVCHLLKPVIEDGRQFDVALEDNDDHGSAFVQQICYGVMRNWYFLHAVVDALAKKPLPAKHLDVRLVIMAGIYSINELNRPAHASVNAAVETTRQLGKPWASGLTNALLRRYQRERDSLTASLADKNTEARYNHPAWLIEALTESWPDYPEIFDCNNQQAPMVLRVNEHATTRSDYLASLKEAGISAVPGTLVQSAVVLSDPVAVHLLPGFSEGLVSVQDEAPQLAAFLLRTGTGERVLDACAAPGGKTCHLLETCPDIQLTAIDRDRKRIGRINDNLQRLSLKAEVTCCALEDYRTDQKFDKILLDTPCSATGILRRHPDIKLLRSPGDIAKLAHLQRELLNKAFDLLKPGGELLYSTCSILPRENDGLIATFLSEREDALIKPLVLPETMNHSNNPAVRISESGCQLLPTAAGHDGFFYSLLEKQGA